MVAHTCNQSQHSGSRAWGIMGSRSTREALPWKTSGWKEKKINISWAEKGKTLAEHNLLPYPLSIPFLCAPSNYNRCFQLGTNAPVDRREPILREIRWHAWAQLSGRAGTRLSLLDTSDSSILRSPPGCFFGPWISLWLNDFTFSVSGCFNHGSDCLDLSYTFLFRIRL